MGRALYCPQASKPSQNLCPVPPKYHIFISLALRVGGVESLKSSALSLCLARRGPQMWFLCDRRGQRRQFSPGMRMEEQTWKEELPWGGSADLGTDFLFPPILGLIPITEIRESKTCPLPWALTCLSEQKKNSFIDYPKSHRVFSLLARRFLGYSHFCCCSFQHCSEPWEGGAGAQEGFDSDCSDTSDCQSQLCSENHF